jgi:hypothetical protein
VRECLMGELEKENALVSSVCTDNQFET